MANSSPSSSLCWRCGFSSSATAKYCGRCGQSLVVGQLDAGQFLRQGSANPETRIPANVPVRPEDKGQSTNSHQPDQSVGKATPEAATRFEAWLGSRSFSQMWAQFWRIVYREQAQRRILSVEDYLATVPLFEELRRGERKKLASIAHRREYAPGEIIYESGTPCVAMFVIRSGAVSLVMPNGEGHETEVVTLGEGMFFDEIAMHTEVPNWVTAKSTAETELLAFPRTDMQRLAAMHPALGYKVLNKLTAILNLRLQLMAQMTFGNNE